MDPKITSCVLYSYAKVSELFLKVYSVNSCNNCNIAKTSNRDAFAPGRFCLKQSEGEYLQTAEMDFTDLPPRQHKNFEVAESGDIPFHIPATYNVRVIGSVSR